MHSAGLDFKSAPHSGIWEKQPVAICRGLHCLTQGRQAVHGALRLRNSYLQSITRNTPSRFAIFDGSANRRSR